MVNDFDWNEWKGDATEEDLRALTAITSKRFKIFLLISIIPIVNWFTMGCAIFCYNNLAILKSRGMNRGSQLLRLILLLYSLIIIPLIVIRICANVESIGDKVLGWD